MGMNCKDIILLDFKYELDNVDFDNEIEKENSYYYMIDQLDIHYREKLGTDESVTIFDIAKIVNILQDEEKELYECYSEIVGYLDNLDN